jgi:hypothetical protein
VLHLKVNTEIFHGFDHIAGIVFGIVMAAVVLVGLIWYWSKKRRTSPEGFRRVYGEF